MQTNLVDELLSQLTDAFDPECDPVEASNLFDGFKGLVRTLSESRQVTATQRSLLGTIHQVLQGKDLVALTTRGRLTILEFVRLLRGPRPGVEIQPTFLSVSDAFRHASEHGHATLVNADGRITGRITIFKDQLPVIGDEDEQDVIKTWKAKPITHQWTLATDCRGVDNIQLLVVIGWTVGPMVPGMGYPASMPIQDDYVEGHEYVVCQECGSHILLDGREEWLDPQFEELTAARLFDFTCDWDACGKEFAAMVHPPRSMSSLHSDLG